MRNKVILLISLVLVVPGAYAQGPLPAFFSGGDVRDWSSAPLELSPQEETKFFPSVPAEDPAPAQLNKQAPSDKNAPKAEKTLAKSTGDEVADKLAAQYGDPSAAPVVAAVDTAPTPFKGMLAAIQAGRDDLAIKYASQYVQYRKDFRAATDKSMALQGLALEHAGMLPADGWQTKPELAGLIDREALLKQLEAEKVSKEKAEDLAGKIEGMLQQDGDMGDAQAFSYAGEQAPAPVNELTEREKARRLAGSVPVDPRGKIDIYLFMMPKDTKAHKMVRELETFKKIHGEAYVPNIAGMVLESVDPILEDDLQRVTNATIPFLDGRKLAQRLKVDHTPVLVFVAQSTRRVHVENGPRSAYFLDELVRIMEGR